MSDYRRYKKIQRIGQLVIAAAGNSANFDANADQLYKHSTGVLLSIIGDESGFQNSVLTKFEIDGQEVFVNGFEAKLISSLAGTDVAPNDKFFMFKDAFGNLVPYPAANCKVSVAYTDGSFAGVTYPYTVDVWMVVENLDEQLLQQSERFKAWITAEFNRSKSI